ncbi:MAG TPA: GH116 family glycosyl-hydrolase [Pseudolysinimonas sp.]|nr:GH116 family glycosyl-hydrolase [Pseudolysinimonas sp.]
MSSTDSAVRGAPVYTPAHPFTAMPLGGIGTGNVALGADGSLRQWQLHNIGNHRGSLPLSFFSLRVSAVEPPSDVVRILQAPVPSHDPTPLVDDDYRAPWHDQAFARLTPVTETRFSATYPVARVQYLDADVPVDVDLEAFTPLVPLDVADSSLPAALFTFTLTSRADTRVHGSLGASLLNAVGWDGVSPIDTVRGAGLGGNTNRVSRDGDWTSVILENPSIDPRDAGAGQMVLSADRADTAVLRQWHTVDEFAAFLASRSGADGRERLHGSPAHADALRQTTTGHNGPSSQGETWAAGIAVPFALEPGETTRIRVMMTWHFPNRYVNFEQFGPARPEWGPTRFWLGNRYAQRFPDATAVSAYVAADWTRLEALTRSWTSGFADSSLDDDEADHLAAQLAFVRSPTCFQAADGRFYGFEGVLGASTTMWNGDVGGSCPLNCTHVWNYVQAVAKVFPELERSMRETEFDIMQAPEGYLPHRLIVPVYLPQLWNEVIGGPDEPALDGMLGSILKTYREYRHGAGVDWLRSYWPSITRLLRWVRDRWDPQNTGVLRGIQPSTHDIDLSGVNPYMGGIWLATLRAVEEIARVLGEDPGDLRELFERGSRSYDELLFTGEYYRQLIEPGDSDVFQWAEGCLTDQLIGQWWAHELDLGYVFPADHVRSALSAIVRHNLRESFRGFEHGYRVYADLDDAGLLLCTWPNAGRPEIPVRYADEVWSGSEYQVAAHCIMEGLIDEGRRVLTALWARHDGTRRNPYNEIECGDHYARAMAGWSVLEALSGCRFDAGSRALSVDPPAGDGRWPFITDTGWGTVTVRGSQLDLLCRGGRVELGSLRLRGEELAAGVIDLAPGDSSTWHATDKAASVPSLP